MSTLDLDRQAPPASPQVDPRGQQFAAGVTTVVLAAVLLLAPSPVATAILAVQAVLFAMGAGLGVRNTPHAWVFRTALRPRIGPPVELEDAAPPRFAQAVGLVFALVGVIGFLTGATLVGLVATGLALTAALLNAAFGLCLGCELYLLGKRVTARTASVISAPRWSSSERSERVETPGHTGG